MFLPFCFYLIFFIKYKPDSGNPDNLAPDQQIFKKKTGKRLDFFYRELYLFMVKAEKT